MLAGTSPEGDACWGKQGGSDKDANSDTDSAVQPRKRIGSLKLWRPSSLVNIVKPIRKRTDSVFDSGPASPDETPPASPLTKNRRESSRSDSSTSDKSEKLESPVKKTSGGWGTLVTIVLVEAKGLPDSPTDGTSHGVYCKIRLGSQTIKSKTVQNLQQPVWGERFQLFLKDHLLRVSLWDKGKQKSFMGSAVLDLSQLEKERTHEIWQQLDDGYGAVHLSLTICTTRRRHADTIDEMEEFTPDKKIAILNPSTEWKLVGQLSVRVVSARGLGRAGAYCLLEVDNERVRTHVTRGGAEHTWNKNFVFNVYDITTTLDLKVYESSLMTSLHSESLGRLSIPLLRVRNGEMKWFALKDKSNRSGARGHCPRVLLEMSLFWNPIKAAIKVFQPREVKYIKKAQKFDIALTYKNMEFTRDTFLLIMTLNDNYKRLFEWENQELSFVALCGWLVFWYHIKLWTAPLLLLLPFFYFWLFNRHHNISYMRGYGFIDSSESDTKGALEKLKPEKKLTNRIQDLPDMTLTITNSVDYLSSLIERIYNLISFKVPFLSFITMLLLVAASAGLYFIPFNFIMMLFGIYKFSRNYTRSEKILNNDIEDFISRVPDTEILNDWKELNVPEPTPVNGYISSRPSMKCSVMY